MVLMNIQRIAYLAKRITHMGLGNLITCVTTKSYRKYINLRYKKKAHALKANHRWPTIARHFKQKTSFTHFFNTLASNRIFMRILTSEQFIKDLPTTLTNTIKLFDYADTFVKNEFSVLGAPKINNSKKIPWHYDIKLQQNLWGTEYWNTQKDQFYQNIILDNTASQSRDYTPDIKVPWELSRLQHIFIIGLAYQQAISNNSHEQATSYEKTFVDHITSWIDNNPYLIGVNWVCPMEVAIRATNIIWGFHMFKSNPDIPINFWEKVIGSLYDHAHYLRYNRETSDKPNNHYMADLVGALYLCVFFKDVTPNFNRKQSSILEKIWEQVAHQIQPDGTCYEGSTNYHKLVTEMLVHVALICQQQKNTTPASFFQTIHTMKSFLQDCTDMNGYLAQIGDNDSGQFVTGLLIPPNPQSRLISYRYAGITIMHAGGWHATYRHPTFQAHQPTGHFHSDELSITISLDKKPLLIDPGSYLYTGNVYWRNLLRSTNAHNTYFIPAFEKEPHDLFSLPRTPHKHEPTVTNNKRIITICDKHLKYIQRGLTAYRKFVFDTNNETLEIHDWLEFDLLHDHSHAHNCVWNFHWAPDIALYQNEPHAWIICRKNKPIAHLTSTLSFTCCQEFYSPSYGIRQPSKTLTATHALSPHHRSIKISRF